MSPYRPDWETFESSFPRVSGDEPPAPEAGKPAAVFSPRERG